MISGAGLDVLHDCGASPCTVCQSGVGANSISCSQCKLWVHKKCSSIKGRLNVTPDYVCSRCLDKARPIDGRPITPVEVDGTLLDVEACFCYLGDMLSAGGGCALAIATRCSTAWGKFRKLLPILTSSSSSSSWKWTGFRLECTLSSESEWDSHPPVRLKTIQLFTVKIMYTSRFI